MTQIALMPEQVFVFHGVSWDYYVRTLEEMQVQHLHPRITFDNGEMEIMTTGPRHEGVKKLTGRLIEAYADEMDIPVTGLGQVTCKRKDLQKGVEADECYYVGTEPPPMPEEATAPLDLSIYPPPDLSVEVDITRRSIPRQPIYAALGVPEIWRFDGRQVVFLRRQGEIKASCEAIERSTVFPSLSATDFNRFLQIGLSKGQHPAVRAMREWVRRGQAK